MIKKDGKTNKEREKVKKMRGGGGRKAPRFFFSFLLNTGFRVPLSVRATITTEEDEQQPP